MGQKAQSGFVVPSCWPARHEEAETDEDEVFDGGGKETDSTTSSLHQEQWVTGKLPIGHDQESQEAEASLRTQTTAESAGENSLRPKDGGLQIEMFNWEHAHTTAESAGEIPLRPKNGGLRIETYYNGGHFPSVSKLTMGLDDGEPKEALGPDKENGATNSESQRIFIGMPHGSIMWNMPHGSIMWNIPHPQQVQSPDDSLAPDEAVAMAMMESQALAWGLDKGSYRTLNELSFPQAACVNGRLVSSPVVVNTGGMGLGDDSKSQQHLDDMSLQHIVIPFTWLSF